MPARIAKSLAQLRDQVNARWPNRSKVSDGWIGDAAHQATASDHNPNSAGVVTALDITHDTGSGPDTWKLAEILRLRHDPRIKYIISNGRICAGDGGPQPWVWRPYNGPNKHAHHVHVSVSGDPAKYDDAGEWALTAIGLEPAPKPPPPKGITADMRRRMARTIGDYEARRVNGKLAVYRLPANDGGGTYEVAGINDRYHPVQAAALKSLVEAGDYETAERAVQDFILAYTNVAAGWTEDAGVEFYLRDCVFNRGQRGAARILQRAAGVTDDGEVGPTTRGAVLGIPPGRVLDKLRAARESYERDVAGYRANFWRGLVNRWDKALVAAKGFQAEQGKASSRIGPAEKVALPVAVALWAVWEWIAAHPLLAVAIVAAAIPAGMYAWRRFKAWREQSPAEPIAPVGSTNEAPQ